MNCENCDGEIVETTRGETVCRDCGVVFNDSRIESNEKRIYDSGEKLDKKRTGSPTNFLRHDNGLVTEIGDSGGDWKVDRLKKRHQENNMLTSQEKSVWRGIEEIKKTGSVLGIPRFCQEQASHLFKKLSEMDKLSGWRIEHLSNSLLYIVCRKNGFPRSLGEFSDYSGIEKTDLGRAERYVASELDIDLSPVNPKDFVPRFCSKLDLDMDVEEKTYELIDLADDEGLLSGRDPVILVSGAIYLAAIMKNQKRTQVEVGSVAGTNQVSVRNRYQELKELIN